MSDFGEKISFKESRFRSFYSLKVTYFAFFVLFEKKKHDFELKNLQRNRFSIWKNTTRQILNWITKTR